MDGFLINKAVAWLPPNKLVSNPIVIFDKRYECTTGGSDKYWEVKVTDNGTNRINGYQYDVHIKYGKMDTRGMSSAKSFSSAKAMNAFIQGKTNEKLGKGYVEVGTSAGVASTAAVVSAPITKATINDLKVEVGVAAQDLLRQLPAGVQGEVIVTMIVGGEVIQETKKT
jgi:predicted DNA-binding WGR domain protein